MFDSILHRVMLNVLSMIFLASCVSTGPTDLATTIQEATANPSATVLLTVTPSETPDPAAGWDEFVDESLGIVFKHPPEWYVYPAQTGGHGATTILSSYSLEDAPPIERALLPREVKVDISFSESTDPGESLDEDWIVANLIHPEARRVTSQETVIGDSKAIKVEYELFSNQSISIFVLQEAGLLSIHGQLGDQDSRAAFDVLISTIRFNGGISATSTSSDIALANSVEGGSVGRLLVVGPAHARYPDGFRLPFEGAVRITSGPTSTENQWHSGASAEAMDFQAYDRNSFPVLAVSSGTAYTIAGWNGGLGNTVMIDHGSDIWSMYSHLASFGISNGQQVTTGDLLGPTGNTGNGAGFHLHFEIRDGVTFIAEGVPQIFSGTSIRIDDHPLIDYLPSQTCCDRGSATGEVANGHWEGGEECEIVLEFDGYQVGELLEHTQVAPCGTENFTHDSDGDPINGPSVTWTYSCDYLNYCGSGEYELTIVGLESGISKTKDFDW